MAKSTIRRNEVRDLYLKQIIIRLDFVGVTNVDALVKHFDKRFPKFFKSRQEIYSKNIEIRENDMKVISEVLSLPINRLEQVKIYRYEEMRDAVERVTLDISQYFLCMTIFCDEHYDGLNNYLECFKGAITVFSNEESYFKPKRLGLRKIRVQEMRELQQYTNVFEPFVYDLPNYDIYDRQIKKSVYIDYFSDLAHDDLSFNIRRECGKGKDTNEGAIQYQFVLDIDAYYQKDSFEGMSISRLLDFANEQEFLVYKSCVSEAYLRNPR